MPRRAQVTRRLTLTTTTASLPPRRRCDSSTLFQLTPLTLRIMMSRPPAARAMARCLCLILCVSLFTASARSLPLDQSPLIQPAISNSTDLTGYTDPTALSHLAVASSDQPMAQTKATVAFLSSLIIYVSLNSLAHALNPSAFIWSAEDREEPAWIASSHSWLDRKACRWLGLCGLAHVHPVGLRFGHRKLAQVEREESDDDQQQVPSWQSAWSSGPDRSNQWDDVERARRQIPDYVFQHAPLVHLFSNEQYWPGDIAEHLAHVTPMLNYTPIQSQAEHPTLRDLDQLNQWQHDGHVFLTSNDNVEDRPPWIEGEDNIPQSTNAHVEESWADWDGRVDGDIPGDTPEDRAQWFDSSDPRPGDDEDINLADVEEELRKRYGGRPIHIEKTGGRSNAPAILLVLDKGNGIVDAFWFYFYSFNLGNVVFDVRFGNHVGDWEHCLVRFHHGQPKALFFSAHSAGEAYSYEALEKIGRRPVIYSAMGTHAMYATPGIHSYILPWGLLHDQTDRGPLWDPLLNAHTYTYDYDYDVLRASTANPTSPTEWFHFQGHWGDKFYPLGDSRQYRFAGQYHYVNGPLGPRFKHLDRHKVCQGPDNAPCVIRNWIGGKSAIRPL